MIHEPTRPKVYIAGPISKGSRTNHLYFFHIAHEELMRDGFAPFNPGMTMQLPFAWDGQFTHEDWLECCFPWVESADVVYRLHGESVGADAEVRHALARDIPVFRDYEQLIDWRRNEYRAKQGRNDNGKVRSWSDFAKWLLRGGEAALDGDKPSQDCSSPCAGM